MKLEITLYTNRKDVAKLKNIDEKPFILEIAGEKTEIQPKKHAFFPPNALKIKLGNWDKKDIFEESRKRMLGVLHYEISFKEELYVQKTVEKQDEDTYQEKETEFKSLELLNKKEEIGQCEKMTQAGKQCKRIKVEGTSFCNIHQK